MALLMAVIASVLLSLLGLALTLTSIEEVRSADAYETYIQATFLAEAAIELSKDQLRRQDFSALLATPGLTAVYPNETGSQPGTVPDRNPISLRAARYLDFASGSFPLTQTTGMLTPPGGRLLGNGRYFVKVTDNRDEEMFDPDDGVPNNPLVDLDEEVIVRAFGVVQNIPGEIVRVGTGSTRANSISIVEASFRRNLTFDVKSPVAVYAPNVLPYQSNDFFHGNSFDLDGYDHSGMTPEEIRSGHNDSSLGAGPGLATLYDNPAGEDGVPTAISVFQNLKPNRYDNIYGTEGMFGPSPSILDITPDIRSSPNLDSPKVFDPNYVGPFLQRLKAYADQKFSGPTHISGGDQPLGTADEPTITYVDGDLDLSGNNSGTGLLVVTGTLKYRGSFAYDGVILVIGKGNLDVSGANKGIVGGLFLANLVKNADGTYSYGIPQFKIGGNSNFYFRSASIRMAIQLLPLKVKSRREVTPELEPAP